MPAPELIVMGASAGGIEAFQRVLSALPPKLPAAVLLVLHVGAETPTMLPRILSRATDLPVEEAEHGRAIRPGRVYVAPSDHHLRVADGRMEVVHGPRENRHRPSIDVLFRSAARSYGARAVGVLLSGLLDDGTAGLQAIKARGGVAIVQDPRDAQFPSMPLSALEYVRADSVAPARDIGPLLVSLFNGDLSRARATFASESTMPKPAKDIPTPGPYKRPMLLSCPECNGVLQEYGDGGLVRFRCHVGHAYSPDSLVEAQDDGLERALWTALRALEESAAVARRMEEHSRRHERPGIARRYHDQAAAKDTHAAVLRKLLATDPRLQPPHDAPSPPKPENVIAKRVQRAAAAPANGRKRPRRRQTRSKVA